jgi:iron complex transport system substrate-binding protein
MGDGGRIGRWRWLGLAVLGLAADAATAGSPQRIVSLNVCADQILVDLVAHERIAAVTHLAIDPLTAAKPERAAGLRTTRGVAEDVIGLAPDLVIVGAYSTPATTALLRRIGLRVEPVPLPDSIAGVRTLIRGLAALVEAPQRGEALIADMDRRLAAVSATTDALRRRPTALVYQVNNFVARSGSVVDEALALAGFTNAAAAAPARSSQVSLETIVALAPDLLVLASGPDAYRTAVADNLRHPALVRLGAGGPRLILPWPLWLCATHHIAEAVERLAEARRALPDR